MFFQTSSIPTLFFVLLDTQKCRSSLFETNIQPTSFCKKIKLLDNYYSLNSKCQIFSLGGRDLWCRSICNRIHLAHILVILGLDPSLKSTWLQCHIVCVTHMCKEDNVFHTGYYIHHVDLIFIDVPATYKAQL